MKPVADHCKFDGRFINCRHCLAMEQIRVPALARETVKQFSDFIGRHKGCKPNTTKTVRL